MPRLPQPVRPAFALLLPALLASGPLRDTPIIRRHDVADARYLELGARFQSIAHLRLPNSRGVADGEGTLIAPRWVLTAAHLTPDIEPGLMITVGDAAYRVDAVLVHPEWDGGPNDLALLRLDRDVSGVVPARLYRDSLETGRVLVLVGYGDTGTGLDGPDTNDWQVRGATNRVDEATGHWLKMRFDAPGDSQTTALEGVSGGGDSGGPAYLQQDGPEVLAGVSSGQSTRATGGKPGRYGVTEYYTRVSRYVAWIEGLTGPLPR
jgi:hypothetical protein